MRFQNLNLVWRLFLPIIAMGSALEVGKLVAASWLYHNWREDIPRALKAYLFTAIIVLIFISFTNSLYNMVG